MADVAISTVPTISTLDTTDKFYVNNDPSTSHAISQIALSDVLTIVQSGVQLTSQKGAANGYAALDATGKVPAAQVPAAASGVTAINTSLVGNVTNVQLTTAKGVANGYAGLDGTGKVPTAQLPGSVQSASRNNPASVSQVIDFNFEQNVILLDQNATPTFSNVQPGAKCTGIFRQDGTGGRTVTFPGTNFVWDTTTGVIADYPGQQTAIGFEVMEDGATVTAYGSSLDSSEVYRLFTGQETFSRDMMWTAGFGSNLAAGTIDFTYFKAKKTQTVNSLNTWCNTASVGATHQFMALCDVNVATWATTIVAITADNTTNTLWGTATAAGTLSSANLTAAYTVRAGHWYAFAVCSVGHSTSPGLISTRQLTATNVVNQLPYMAGTATQATYPTVGTSYAWTTNITAFNTMYYGVML